MIRSGARKMVSITDLLGKGMYSVHEAALFAQRLATTYEPMALQFRTGGVCN